MAEKKGAGGKPQAYDESTGRYGAGQGAGQGTETAKEYRQGTTYEEIKSDGITKSKKADKPTPTKLAVDTPEARELFDRLVKADETGEFLSYEELMEHPVVQKFYQIMEAGNAVNKELISETEAREKAQEFVAKARGVPKEKRVDIVMGLPSAGKSTRVVDGIINKHHSFEFDNDEIKKMLDGLYEYGPNYVHEDSKEIQKIALDSFTNPESEMYGTNLAIPIVGSSAEGVRKKWIDKFIKAGYNVYVHNTHIENARSLNRVVKRAIEKGVFKYVPLHVVREYGEEPTKAFNELKQQNYGGGKVQYVEEHQ